MTDEPDPWLSRRRSPCVRYRPNVDRSQEGRSPTRVNAPPGCHWRSEDVEPQVHRDQTVVVTVAVPVREVVAVPVPVVAVRAVTVPVAVSDGGRRRRGEREPGTGGEKAAGDQESYTSHSLSLQ